MRVRGGRLALAGGTVRGPGRMFVRSGGRADLGDVTFEYANLGGSYNAGSPTVTYDVLSTGSVDNGRDSWDLSVASSDVSVLSSTINVLTLSASATVVGSIIGYVNLNGGVPAMTERPQWGAEITALLQRHLGRLHEETGIPTALRVTVVDLREARRRRTVQDHDHRPPGRAAHSSG